MSPQPLDLYDVLSRFNTARADSDTTSFCQQTLALMKAGKLLEAANRAQAALRDAAQWNDRILQAIASAYFAAVHALQGNFIEAVGQANDCYRLFNHMTSRTHDATVARALLACIYQRHLEVLSDELTQPLEEGQAKSDSLERRALSKSQIDRAMRYRQQFVEFGEQIRRARWIAAVPYALPLVWLPVISTIPPDPDTQGAEPVGYMEPVLFVLRGKQDVEREDSPDFDPGQIVDQLYTARPLPPIDGLEPAMLRPPRLHPNVRYAAIKVDPDSARLAGLEPDDYLLVRSLSSAERAELLKRADDNITGFYFRLNADGEVEVVKAIPPKFVGEEHIKMLVAQADAILRRVP
jgi:hypothetical protein